ncbi:Hypothetical protein bglu_2g11370 [Burkholderia glumae BGR1]|nr:Hypothetical protein bglu_2g11370 [Burkholderia glumae BGR1]
MIDFRRDAPRRVANVLRAGRNSPPAVIMLRACSPRTARLGCARRDACRPGAIPGPTVIVRMRESGVFPHAQGVRRGPVRPFNSYTGPCR